MIEVEADLWEVPCDVRCITTNGSVKTRNDQPLAVMGRGCAREAAQKYPGLETFLGMQLLKNGNVVQPLMRATDGGRDWELYAFPVKHEWHQNADLELIKRSSRELLLVADLQDLSRIVLPRPGCGNGHLRWAEVRRALSSIFDDRFTVVDFPPFPPVIQ